MADRNMADLPKFALSIRQPWAWAIVHAGKDIENRNWMHNFRGPVCIHASKSMTGMELDDAADFMRSLDVEIPRGLELQRGGIIGTAEIVDCVDSSESPWFVGRYGFVLRNARPVEFIPVKGLLGFFNWRWQIGGAP